MRIPLTWIGETPIFGTNEESVADQTLDQPVASGSGEKCIWSPEERSGVVLVADQIVGDQSESHPTQNPIARLVPVGVGKEAVGSGQCCFR